MLPRIWQRFGRDALAFRRIQVEASIVKACLAAFTGRLRGVARRLRVSPTTGWCLPSFILSLPATMAPDPDLVLQEDADPAMVGLARARLLT